MRNLVILILSLISALSGAQLVYGPTGTLVDVLSDQKPTGTTVSQKNEWLTVTHGSTVTVCSTSGFNNGQGSQAGFSGPGYISQFSLQISGASSDNTCATGSTLTIVTDGVTTVSMPLVDFMMSHYKVGGDLAQPSFFSKFFYMNATKTSAGKASFACMLPIPFTSSVSITITNGSSTNSMTFWSMATVQTGVPNTWPYTRKLWAARMAVTSSTTINSTETCVNVAPGKRGRYVGTYFMDDGSPGSVSSVGGDQEGNWRIYADCFNTTWQATTAYASSGPQATLLDSNGNLEKCTSSGTSGSSQPTWTTTPGGTTSDGTVTWTMTAGEPTTVWNPSKTYTANVHSIIDSNGNLEVCTTGGTSGSSMPSWATTNGSTTTDNTATWTCYTTHQAAIYDASGTEDYFGTGFNFEWIVNTNLNYLGSTGETAGVTFFNSSSGLPITVSAYRFHVVDPIRFQSAFAIFRQQGDSSQNNISGYPEIWTVVYYYTE